jgi:hypothetical protein
MSVGTTRIAAQAGAVIDLKAYLAGDLAEIQVPIIINNVGWLYGTGANCVNIIYQDKVTLADGANTTLDLYASGTLLDVFNRALTMSSLKLLYIKNNSADATLEVGGGAALDLLMFKDTSDVIKIKPGGVFIWVDPSAAGTLLTTNKNLKLTHDGTGASTMDVDVVVLGLD